MPLAPKIPRPSVSGVLRLLHLADHPSRGGASRAAARVHRGLSGSTQVDSIFLTFRGSALEPEAGCENLQSFPRVFESQILNRISSYFRHLIGPKWRLLYDFLLSRNITLENRLGSGDTDIFLIHWVRPRDVPARSLRRIDVPAVVVLHDARFILGISHYPESAKEPLRLGSLTWRERIASALVRASLNPNRTTLICPSLWMRDVAIQAGWPEETISYVPYPIDLNFWRPIPEFVSQKENNQFRIGFGFAGEHAAFRKGADIFSGALEMLSKGPIVGGPELEFLYFGDAIPPQFPKSLPRSISLQTLGHLDDSELRLLFTQLDLVIIPSRQESMGQIALEAQACGTAVVVSQDTGLASALVPGGGWTFANGSASDLAAVINLALSDRSELKLRGLTARQGIHHLFSEEVVVEKYISHLRAVGRLTNR